MTQFYTTKPLELRLREKSNWQCLIVGESLVLRPSAGDEPNALHRWMQRLAFGFRWERVNEADRKQDKGGEDGRG